MKVVYRNLEEGVLKVEPESLEDLYGLTKIIEKDDQVAGKSWRRWKNPDANLNKPDSGEKKPVFIMLKAETIEFAESANKLRITGSIVSGNPEEFVQVGEFHTLDVELHGRVEIHKQLTPYHLELLDEMKKKSKAVKALIVAMDDEKATFAMLRSNGITYPLEIGNRGNKRDPSKHEELTKAYYREVSEAITRTVADKVIIAGPGFTGETFKKWLNHNDTDTLKRVSFQHASTSERSAATELLKQGALEAILGAQRVQESFKAFEEFKLHVAKEDGYAVYGVEDVEKAITMGAVGSLLILDEFLRDHKTRRLANSILARCKNLGAEIVIFASNDGAANEFKSFRVAAVLRFKMQY